MVNIINSVAFSDGLLSPSDIYRMTAYVFYDLKFNIKETNNPLNKWTEVLILQKEHLHGESLHAICSMSLATREIQIKTTMKENKLSKKYVDVEYISLHGYIRNTPSDTEVLAEHQLRVGRST